MEQYANNSVFVQVDIDEVEECFLGPEYADVARLKADLKKAEKFGVFKVKEEGERSRLAASKWRWNDWQRQSKVARGKSLEGKPRT